MADVNAFISYARSDAIIADTIDRELGFLAGSRLECFLDTKSIEPGVKWQPLLVDALKKADWLLCVFTGEQSEYCGFEIGIFSTAHGLIGAGSPSDKRIVCLHDVEQDAVPTFLKDYNGIHITFPDEDPAIRGSAALEEDAWYATEVAQFLQDFGAFKTMFPLRPRDIDRYKKRISDAAKAISHSFRQAKGNDVKESTACQTMMDVHIPPSTQELTAIPDTAYVTGDAFPILGLMPPTSTGGGERKVMWTELRAKVKPVVRPEAPWIERIEDDIVCAAAKRQLSGDDTTFTGSDGKVYRPILGRHNLYMNGLRTFRVLFVETLNRQFPGDLKTSALLTSLVMASRFYFKYFEHGDAVLTAKFSDQVSDDDFQDNCRQLAYDLDRMEQEAIEYGIGDPKTMVEAFGDDVKVRVERFFGDWGEARNALFASLSHSRETLTPDRRRELKQAVDAFFAAVRKQNADYLKLAIERYRTEMLEHLRRADRIGGRALFDIEPDPRTAVRVIDPLDPSRPTLVRADEPPAAGRSTAARAAKSPRRRSKNGGAAPSATN